MWKPIDETLAQHLASEVAQAAQAVCPRAIVTYATTQGYPLDIDLPLEVYNVTSADRERIKAALGPLTLDVLKRLNCLVSVFYRSELPPDGARRVEITEATTATAEG
jgi:hypothetical protein